MLNFPTVLYKMCLIDKGQSSNSETEISLIDLFMLL